MAFQLLIQNCGRVMILTSLAYCYVKKFGSISFQNFDICKQENL